MGDAQTVQYPITRVALSGHDNAYGDPKVIRKMIKDISEGIQSDGTLKARHPSDRSDVHAYIEYYSYLWVESLREYYDNTNDVAFVYQMWDALQKQMQSFLNDKTSNGLIKVREFIIFDNSLLYKEKEDATVNVFIYKALKESAYLSDVINDTTTIDFYEKEMVNINRH